MIIRLLLVLFTTSMISFSQSNDDLVPWIPSKRLTWEDFKGPIPSNATNAALTSSSILVNFSYNNQSLRYTITCHFDKNKSWVRIKNDHILAHEQGHFDITEIHARKLYKSLQEYHFRQNSVSEDINAIYQKVINELQQMQTEYDSETDHSRNFVQQRNWLLKIENSLTALKDYADYRK